MDIRHLKTFATVARLGSVTRAAEALHITQPAVSAQLKSLEEGLGLKLLTRTTTSVALTSCGQELLQRADRTIEAFGDFLHAARSLRGEISGTLRVGVPLLDPEELRIGAFMQEMSVRHPALRIDLHAGRTPWLLDALRSADFDAALYVCRSFPRDMGGVVLKPLRYVPVAPRRWAERFPADPWPEAAQRPWIRMTPHSAHEEMLGEILARQGLRPLGTVLADHELMIYALVASEVGIGLVREDLALRGEREGVMARFGADGVDTTLSFIHPVDRRGDPAIAATCEAIARVWTLPPLMQPSR